MSGTPDELAPATDVGELAARFSSQGGAGLSPELATVLALEIVLNEIVEQACLATGATGAAIVLKRGDEMVCRGSIGSTAPDLGSLLDTSSGLSGECVRTLRTQRCNDVLTDDRADVAASFRLGVRSVMVMPLVRGDELLGVIELFSSRACAFGDRDERTLEALAIRTLASLERAEHPPIAEVRPGSDEPGDLASCAEYDAAKAEMAADSAANAGSGAEVRSAGAGKSGKGGVDIVTTVLGVAVVACAVLLGVAMGTHLGMQKAKIRVPPAAPLSPGAPAAAASTSASSSGKAAGAGLAAPPAISSKPRVNSAVPPGGLLVLENGKEVFRMPPTPGDYATAAAGQGIGMQRAASIQPEQSEPKIIELLPAEAESNLLQRVEPQYPAEARQQQIQGAVVLELHIAADGTVEAVHLVSGPPQLVQAATDAVKQWRFQPRSQNGQPALMHTLITLNFRLTR
jgi:TonB family protein